MSDPHSISCPKCQHGNRADVTECVICKTPLQRSEAPAGRPRPRPRPRPPGRGLRPTMRLRPLGPGAARRRPTPSERHPRPRPGASGVQRRPGASGVQRRPGASGVQRRPGPVARGASGRLQRPNLSTTAQQAPPPPQVTPPDPTPASLSTAKIVGWVCCDPMPPLPVGPGVTLTIGRSPDCHLTLPHKEVSRVHALIKVRGTTLTFEDNGSSNGSFCNGKRVMSAPLGFGDKLAIGPYEIVIRSPDQMLAEHEEDTRSLNMTLVTRVNPSAAMTGMLEEVPLTELLQGIEFNHKTGTLVIESQDGKGTIVALNGKPQFATFQDLTDDEAVVAMLRTIKSGRFTLSGEVCAGESTMHSTLTGLLLEAARRADESGSHEVQAEPSRNGSGPHPTLGNFDTVATESLSALNPTPDAPLNPSWDDATEAGLPLPPGDPLTAEDPPAEHSAAEHSADGPVDDEDEETKSQRDASQQDAPQQDAVDPPTEPQDPPELPDPAGDEAHAESPPVKHEDAADDWIDNME